MGQDIFRYDTRIYLETIASTKSSDRCIGAVVAKNPGSAKASNLADPALQQICLDGDMMLPTVRSIISRAYDKAGKKISTGEYIQVLNLFYLCNKDPDKAILAINGYASPMICHTEANFFPWIWYLWGNENKRLSMFKHRFSTLNSPVHFYLDKYSEKIVGKAPNQSSFAKHTQGMTQKVVIDHIASII